MIVLPLFTGLTSVLPAMDPLMRQVQSNYDMWQQQ